jgi:hypothetical protein
MKPQIVNLAILSSRLLYVGNVPSNYTLSVYKRDALDKYDQCLDIVKQNLRMSAVWK